MNPIGFGILGFGRFAEHAIAPALRAARGVELVALQKRSPGAAREAAARCDVKLAFGAAEDLVGCPDVDAVFIASANSAHAPETLLAARHGKHVLVEKPMAVSVAEAEAMLDACRSAGVQLMVGHMVRLSPVVRRVRELVRSGELGRVTHARAEFVYDARLSHREWLTDRRVAGGGPLFDVGVHCLDTLRFVLSDEVESIAAQFEPLPTAERTERTVTAALRFRGGATASLHCSYDSPLRRSHLEVLGTEGVAVLPEFTRGSARARLAVGRRSAGEQPEWRHEEFEVPNLYVAEIELFADAIHAGRLTELTADVGLANQRLLEAALLGAGPARP